MSHSQPKHAPIFRAMLSRRAAAVAGVLALTAVLGAFAARVKPDYSIEMIFPRFDRSRVDYDRFKKDFPFEDAHAIVVVEAPDSVHARGPASRGRAGEGPRGDPRRRRHRGADHGQGRGGRRRRPALGEAVPQPGPFARRAGPPARHRHHRSLVRVEPGQARRQRHHHPRDADARRRLQGGHAHRVPGARPRGAGAARRPGARRRRQAEADPERAAGHPLALHGDGEPGSRPPVPRRVRGDRAAPVPNLPQRLRRGGLGGDHPLLDRVDPGRDGPLRCAHPRAHRDHADDRHDHLDLGHRAHRDPLPRARRRRRHRARGGGAGHRRQRHPVPAHRDHHRRGLHRPGGQRHDADPAVRPGHRRRRHVHLAGEHDGIAAHAHTPAATRAWRGGGAPVGDGAGPGRLRRRHRRHRQRAAAPGDGHGAGDRRRRRAGLDARGQGVLQLRRPAPAVGARARF